LALGIYADAARRTGGRCRPILELAGLEHALALVALDEGLAWACGHTGTLLIAPRLAAFVALTLPRGIMGVMKNDVLRLPGPWWLYAAFALITGFGSAQDNARRLDSVTGWSLVGTWALFAGGVVVLVGTGWIALAKFRMRGTPTPSS
jgi:hypothetical protein